MAIWLGKLAAHLSCGLRGDNEPYKGNHGQPGILDLLGLQLLHRMVILKSATRPSLYTYAQALMVAACTGCENHKHTGLAPHDWREDRKCEPLKCRG